MPPGRRRTAAVGARPTPFARTRTASSASASASASARLAEVQVLELPRDAPAGDLPAFCARAAVEVYRPASGSASGLAFFMHGFSQDPKAYASTLAAIAAEGAVVLAPTVNMLSPTVWLPRRLERRAKEMGFARVTFANFADVLQYSLQASLVDDTLLAVEYARAEIAPALAPADPPEMVVGHSMGGRLSYFTASEAGIGNTMTMSPYPQLEGKFDPAVVLAGGGFAGKRTLCLNGALDCIASPEKNLDLVAAVNAAAGPEALPPRDGGAPGLFLEIPFGTHTGYEDQLFLFGEYDMLGRAGRGGGLTKEKDWSAVDVLAKLASFPGTLAQLIDRVASKGLSLLDAWDSWTEERTVSQAALAYAVREVLAGRLVTANGLQADLRADRSIKLLLRRELEVQVPDSKGAAAPARGGRPLAAAAGR